MAIDWEKTLRSWSKPSSDHESEKQENAERMVSEAVRLYKPFASRNIKVIPQGSYRNNTNVRQESDVDICVCCMNPFYADYTFADYNDVAVGNVNSDYSFTQFKAEVQAALESKFGKNGVKRGNKAFDVHANTYRVDADVVPAFAYRLYLKKQFIYQTQSYYMGYVQPEGTKFVADNGFVIVNWPEQHYMNGVEKNKNTGGRFKQIVRATKRLRYHLQDKGHAAAGPIASYLIECLMYNVTDNNFGGDSYTENVNNALLVCAAATQNDAACREWIEVNGMKYLFRSNQPWTRQQAYDFAMDAWAYIANN